MILFLGNYLNAGSRLECAVGFEIEEILNLRNLRPTTSSSSANASVDSFHGVLQRILHDHFPELVGFQSRLAEVDLAPHNWSMSDAKAELEFLEEGFKQVERNNLVYKPIKKQDPYKVIGQLVLSLRCW